MDVFRLSDKAKNNPTELSGRHAPPDPVRPRADAPPEAADPRRADRRRRRRSARSSCGSTSARLHADGTTVLLTTHYLEEAEAAVRGDRPAARRADRRARHRRPVARGLQRRQTSPASTRRRWRSPTENTARWHERDSVWRRRRSTPPARRSSERFAPSRSPFSWLLQREVVRYLRIWYYSILGQITTPLLMLLIFGFALNHQVKGTGGVLVYPVHPARIDRADVDDGRLHQRHHEPVRRAARPLHQRRARRARCAGGRSTSRACSRR